MKIINLLLAIVVIATLNCNAQTPVPVGNVSGTWTPLGSPYNVQGSITIADATTLTIQPGVTVNFIGTYRLNVQGRLLAIGTSTDTIIFTSANTNIGWRSIHFDNTPITNDTSKLYFCKLEYGKATSSAPNDNGGALYFNNFSKAIISNCAISNCAANHYGGGIYCGNSGPIITNNIISNDTIYYLNNNGGGAGICCDNNSSPTISNNTISNNIGGFHINGAGIFSNNSNPFINNNNISNNTTDGDGGGIYCNASNVTITDNIISNNIATPNSGGIGGGVTCLGGSTIISNNTISNNISSYGSGIFLQNENSTISNNSISNNTSSSNGGGGAGIYLESSNANITNNIIINNSDNSTWGGGGISCRSSNLSTNISNNIISNNSTLGGGGGIECFINSTPTITNNLIANNNAVKGGALYCTNSSPTFTNNTIANNNATNGGALYCTSGSSPVLRNNILWGNTASSLGTQVYLFDQGSEPNFYYCDVQGSSVNFELNGNTYTGDYQNNIDIDPLFVSPSGGSGTGFNGLTANWSLQGTSPCVDAGSPNIVYTATDIIGNLRVSGCHIDMGAYEYQTGIIPPHFSQNLTICNGQSVNIGIHTYTTSGNYIDILTSFLNCDSTVTTNLTVDSIDTSVSVSATTLTANVTSATYQWINCNGNSPIGGQSNQSFIATIDGNYAVIITKNGCSDTSACHNITTAGIFENTFASTINIYPNPFTSQTSINFGKEQKSTIIKIIDMLGKEVRSIDFSGKQLIIEKGEMKEGIYFLQIIDDNKNLVNRKLITQ